MQQVIYLQADDDLPAIQHLLEGAQAKRILLVVPKNCLTLRTPLNLRLLRRHAARLALDVALVCRDGLTREAAREEGIPVLPSLAIARWERWQLRPVTRSSAERAATARIAGIRSGRGDPGYGDKVITWAGRIMASLLFVVLLLVVVGLAVIVVPEARITLVPYRQTVDTTLELRADPEADKPSLKDLVVPARLVEAQVEETGEIATLNKRDAPDAPATGVISFINQVAAPREILPGAIVRTSTGTTIRFRTVTTATLEARIGATAQADIEALEPGPVGNVPAATINTVETAELRGKVRVTNEKPTQGGGVKQVGVVTRADMDRLKAQLLQQLAQRSYVELQGELSEQEFLPPESMTVEIMSEVYDQFLDAQADTLHLTLRVYATGTAVDRANARLLAYQVLKEEIPDAYKLTSDEIQFELSDTVGMDGRSVLLTANAAAALLSDIDRRAVRSAVAGLTVGDAVDVLTDSFTLGAPPEVEVQPDWVKRWRWLDRVPFLPFRIQVIVLK